MFYFSELKGKAVVSHSRKSIGKLTDFFFLPSDPALVTTLVVKKAGVSSFFPVHSIQSIGKTITLKNLDVAQDRSIYELSLVKNVLDKQIIDVKGGKVVRVNDVLIQHGEEYYIAGVDIGFRAILRWLKLENAALPIYKALHWDKHPHFLSWGEIEPLELARGKVKLKKEADDLEKMKPEDLADYLEQTNVSNVDEIINNLDQEFAADVIEDLNPSYQTALFERFSSNRASQLLSKIDPDEAVDILLTLPSKKQKEILSYLKKPKEKELLNLMRYSKTPIGELINPQCIWVYENDSLGHANDYVKKTITDSHFSIYVYVKNKKEELVGVMDLSELIRHSSRRKVRDVMVRDIIVIHLTTPKEITIKKILKYKLSALPVIDNEKKLLGVVLYDDLVEEILSYYESA